ncbi:MAG: hypothetical protein DMF64_10685 [Acidobacteria bacterium]|nr:MAG: hypothetical protein DMF64_10685 [Acidobacteriota bacterium]
MSARTLFAPTLAPMLARRSVALVISVVAIIQTALVWANLPAWPCPFAHVLGVACPGCGLSRATIALVRGDWRTALALHAYAPFFLCALIMFGCAALLPARPRDTLVATVTAVEQRTGLTALLLIGLICYWLARLLFAPNTMSRLVRG